MLLSTLNPNHSEFLFDSQLPDQGPITVLYLQRIKLPPAVSHSVCLKE